jgi:hypothetical protein
VCVRAWRSIIHVALLLGARSLPPPDGVGRSVMCCGAAGWWSALPVVQLELDHLDASAGIRWIFWSRQDNLLTAVTRCRSSGGVKADESKPQGARMRSIIMHSHRSHRYAKRVRRSHRYAKQVQAWDIRRTRSPDSFSSFANTGKRTPARNQRVCRTPPT